MFSWGRFFSGCKCHTLGGGYGGKPRCLWDIFLPVDIFEGNKIFFHEIKK